MSDLTGLYSNASENEFIPPGRTNAIYGRNVSLPRLLSFSLSLPGDRDEESPAATAIPRVPFVNEGQSVR